MNLRLTVNETTLQISRGVCLWTNIECCRPERRDEYLRIMKDHLEGAQALCRDIRKGLYSDVGLDQWLRRRTLGSKYTFMHVCESAASFYLNCEEYKEAWTWIQKGRAQVLQDMMVDRETAAGRMLMTLNNTTGIAEHLAKEQRLLHDVQNADPTHYFEAKQKLEAHRARMRTVPALRTLLDGPEGVPDLSWDNLDDVWKLKAHLPDHGITLVDWFIDSKKTIWRLDVCYQARHSVPRYTWGYMTVAYLDQWKRKYLRFPSARNCPLRNRWKAVHQLRGLLTGLENSCAPNDLIILSTTGILAGIPIHAIPFGGQPGTVMIQRNPVIYSGGLNLMRQCIKRAATPRPLEGGSFLSNAVFTSAYEEEGYEKERDEIYESLAKKADTFNCSKLLGDSLTLEGMQNALLKTRWIHYHGHAFYAKTEALNQCLVLGSLKSEERSAQSRVEPSIVKPGTFKAKLGVDLPFEAPADEREALLSSHLLEGRSRLTVADVFAMDLSKTNPVVINIACDSGVQEFSAGDDPLGLVSALFCAGASSVLGTLWPIESSCGRLFTEKFYLMVAASDVLNFRNARDPGYRVVNIALAYQLAVLAVKAVRPDPYAWAPFVLQGAPFYFYEQFSQLGDMLEKMRVQEGNAPSQQTAGAL